MAAQKQKKYFFNLSKAEVKENLIPSTISVTTSFVAVYLTFRRSPYLPWHTLQTTSF